MEKGKLKIQGLEDENVRLATTLQQGRKAFVRICNRMDVLFASAEPKGPIGGASTELRNDGGDVVELSKRQGAKAHKAREQGKKKGERGKVQFKGQGPRAKGTGQVVRGKG